MLFVLLIVLASSRKYSWHTKLPLPEYGDNFDLWFDDQFVDHFDLQNLDTFSQRYFLNDTFYEEGAPLFIMCGGEAPESQASVNGHYIINDYAQMYNALIVSVEARFYGKTLPAKDLTTDSLKLLTTDQVLADFAVFSQYIKNKHKTGDIVLFGGSYSGDVSAWLKMKYNQLFIGSLATSAPTFASLDFYQYMEVVQNSISYYSSPCLTNIKDGMDAIDEMLTNSSGREYLSSLFNTCEPISSEALDISTFVSSLTDPPCEIVQYNLDNFAGNNRSVDWMCKVLENNGGSDDPVTAYSVLMKKYLGESTCVETSYQKLVNELKNTQPYPENENAASRSWTYQTCVEFGWYQTTTSDQQPFPPLITMDYFHQMCQDVFGLQMKPRIDWINLNYGGYEPSVEGIFFPRGSVDPWHIECTDLENTNLDTMLMKGAAHCADLYPPKESGEIPDVAKARQHFVGLLKNWLG